MWLYLQNFAFPAVNIKNYTSGIAKETTISRIEWKLAAIGATHITKTYGPNASITSIIFNIPNGNRSVPIRLPANVHACYEALWRHYCATHRQPRETAKQGLFEQAERTAWKLVQDWIDVQVSMVEMKQAEALQVFLPYAWDGKQTLFEAMKGGGFKALPESTEP